MTGATKTGLLIGLAMLMAGCVANSERPKAPEPSRPIDAARFFTGRWYEIARTPMKLTDGCVAGTTDYYRAPDGQLMDRDACRTDTPEGKEKVYEGPVTFLNPGSDTKVSVRYTVWGFVPVSRTYWMLDHDADYGWFIVSDPEFENVSFFTRQPRPSTAEVKALTERVRSLGYDASKLEYPMQFRAGEK